MTPEEARLQLDATTLRPQDASEEARAMVEHDAELGAWVASRTEFDERMSAAMDDIPIPGHLHEKLLRMAGKTGPVQRRVMPRAVMWLAAAAALVIMAGIWWMNDAKAKGWQSEALAKVQLVEHGMSPLQHRARSLDALMKLVASTNTVMPMRMPDALMKLNTFGCRTIEVAGKPATIVCFELAPGKEVHLVVMNEADLNGAPPQKSPVFSTQGGWTMAAWSDGPQSFMLATSADAEMLKKLFA
jgi:hypothetical protein